MHKIFVMQTENLVNDVVNTNEVVNENKVLTATSKLGEKILKQNEKSLNKLKKIKASNKSIDAKEKAVDNIAKKVEKNSKDLTVLNLKQFSKQLSTMELKIKQKKDTLYIYPENMSETDKTSDKGKKFRNGLRNQIQRFCNNIFVYTKSNDPILLKKEIALFTKFYKEHYRINDFSAESISQSKNDAKFKSIQFMMQIINSTKK